MLAALMSAFYLATAVAALSPSPSPSAPPLVYVLPLGGDAGPDDADVREIIAALEGMYGFRVRALPGVALPRAAYHSPRRRYRAERLLTFLADQLPEDGARIIGVSAADISTTKGKYPDWGVMGLADIGGRAAVISSFRCRKGARDPVHARARLVKVAVHELGHTLGLEHCPNAGCLMEDARGKVATTDGETDLCARCRGLLAARGHRLPAPRN